MPKNMNIRKAASAMHQNQKQIKAAFNGTEVIFAAVEKSLGRAQFLLKLTNHKTATGAPRGLFTSGTMRISPGQIVIVEGSEKLGYEIVGRIEQLAEAKKLVKIGAMPADVLMQATSCGSIEEEDDLFERTEEQADVIEPSMKGGVKGARRQQESMAAAVALAGRLGSNDLPSEIDIDAI
jgi:translation initiation factor IF-1